MANSLTGLIPVMYEALDRVSREMVGAIRAVSRDSSAASAAKNQIVRSAIAPEATLEEIVPDQQAPYTGDQNIGFVDISITKSYASPILWTGEEQLSVQNQPNILVDQFAQSMRKIVNSVEADIMGEYVKASRAYGLAGTAPFGTNGDLSDVAGVLQILEENGASTSDLHLVLGSAAIANLRGKQAILFQVNTSGTDDLLRRGVLGDLEGMAVHNSAQAKAHTKGTASGATTDAAGYDVGSTAITLASAGTGTILAGDVVTFAGDANKYLVTSGDADVSNGGTVTLAEPGLRIAIGTAATDITVGNSYRANLAFARNALHLVTRAPAMPAGGDAADDVMTITDPISGLSFQVAMYRKYRSVKYEIGMGWGYQMIKPAHACVLLG